MQRVKGLSRRTEEDNTNCKTPISSKRLTISSDIIWLLSFHDNRIRKIIRNNPGPCKPMMSSKDVTKELSLKYDTPVIFNYDLRFFINLQNLEIYKSKKVYFSSFSERKFDCLIFDSIGHFDFENTTKASAFSIVLKNMEMNLKEIIHFLDIFKPKSITLENIALNSKDMQSIHAIYSRFSKLGILEFKSNSSFFSLEEFLNIVKSFNIQNFLYKDSMKFIAQKTRGPMIRYFHTNIGYFEEFKESIKDIEYIHCVGTGSTLKLSAECHKLRYLQLENILVDSELIKKILGIRFLDFKKCAFEPLGFYELINLHFKSLRLLTFHETVLPLDGILYLKQKLVKCQVVLNHQNSFFVSSQNSK